MLTVFFISILLSLLSILLLQLTLNLQTTRYHGHPAMLTRASPPKRIRNDWNKLLLLRTLAITDPRYYRNAPPPPFYQRTSFHLFFSHLSGHWSTSSNIHYFICLEKNNLFLSRTQLLRAHAITDINLPPRVSIWTGVDCIIIILLFL